MPRSKSTSPLPARPLNAEFYDSYEAAAAALGIEPKFLQFLRKAGCPGFKGSRTFPGRLISLETIQWFARNDPAAGAIRRRLEIENREREARASEREFSLAKKRGEFIRVEMIVSQMTRFATAVKRVLVQKEAELPALMANATDEAIREIFRKNVSDALISSFRREIGEWSEEKPPDQKLGVN